VLPIARNIQKGDPSLEPAGNLANVGSMDLALNPVSISTRRKLASILLSIAIFATLAGLASRANGRPGIFAILNAIFVGTAVGFLRSFMSKVCAAVGSAISTP